MAPMSSSASSHHPREPLPSQGSDADSARTSRSSNAIPAADNQQTVISHRPPIHTLAQDAGDTEPRRLSTITLGARLGDIELTEHIGGGGMGQVFRGEDKRLGRAVAVKVLARDQSADPDAVRRFLNEAKSAARLNHQNIAQVYSAGESEEHPYIVFEYVQGVNLRSMLEEQGPLTLEEALSYTLQIADALAHSADRGIVHRDVKPSNVLIAPNGQAKLIDLGLARLSVPQGESDGDLTASGVTLGTFDYISPEQARDPRNADSRSDIYSLGCTLFYMLAGRPPFPEGTVLQKLLQHQGDDPPDVCQFRPDLPDELSQVLGKMMAKDPRRRYPDSARLMEALLTLADMIGLRPTGPAQAIWLPPQESRISTLHRQTPWLAPTLTLACLILTLHLFWSSHEEPEDMRGFGSLGRQGMLSRMTTDDESAGLPTPSPSPDAAGDEATNNSTESDVSGNENSDSAADTPDGLLGLLGSSSRPHFPQSLLPPPAPNRSLPPLSLTASFSHNVRVPGVSAQTLSGPAAGGLSAPTTLAAEPRSAAAPANGISPAIPIVITPTPQDENQYRSLGAALAANREATLIELRYDGRSDERPFTVSDRQLTIRAGAGYAPILVFAPTGTDPVLCPRDMIHVSDSVLELSGIAVELEVPRNMPSESWALVRLSTGGRVRFDSCPLRVRNASDTLQTDHKDVAFFRMTPEESPTSSPAERVWTERKPDIELLDCIAFGEAGLLRAPESTPFRMVWHDGFLATTESAFSIGGSSRKLSSDMGMDIEWERVTARTGDSLIKLTLAPHRPFFAPIDLSGFTECVLSSGDQPLIQVNGATKSISSGFDWATDPSVLQESSTPLLITDASGSAVDPTEILKQLGIAEQSSPSPRLLRRVAGEDRPMHALDPDDFELNFPETGSPETASSSGYRTDRATAPPDFTPPSSN